VGRGCLQDKLAAAAPVRAAQDLTDAPDLDGMAWNLRRQPADRQLTLLRRGFRYIEVRKEGLPFVAEPEGGSYHVALPPRWEPAKNIGERKSPLSPYSLPPNIASFNSR